MCDVKFVAGSEELLLLMTRIWLRNEEQLWEALGEYDPYDATPYEHMAECSSSVEHLTKIQDWMIEAQRRGLDKILVADLRLTDEEDADSERRDDHAMFVFLATEEEAIAHLTMILTMAK